MIDFTKCEIEYKKVYDGLNGTKLAIYYNDDLYMLKFPKDTHISGGYASSTINEHISSNIFKILGFKTQDTLLGYYDDKIVVACKDFEGFDGKLYNFGKVTNSIPNSSISFIYNDLADTLETIENQKMVNKKELKEFFWDMFIVDTLIANFDRHNGNWGVLLDKDRDISIAPVYDCGSSLYPKLNNEDIEKYLSHQGSFNDLMLNTTTSALTTNKKKINPQNFLFNTDNEDCKKSLEKITNKIDLEKINKLIDSVDVISEQRKEFYKLTLKARKEGVLEKALKSNKKVMTVQDILCGDEKSESKDKDF